MAIIVAVDDPDGLVRQINDAIDSGEIETWEYDGDGDFTHSPSQWDQQAWFRPFGEEERVVFGIIPQSGGITNYIYGVYHGRFVEM